MRKFGPHFDTEATRRVQRELARRAVNTAGVQVRVNYGVVYLTGVMKRVRGMPPGILKQELEIIRNILLHLPGVREIVDRDLELDE